MLDLFDSKGAFTPLADDAKAALNPIERKLYAAVESASAACVVAETALTAIETELRETVKQIRSTEAKMAALPRVTHFDLVKEMRGQRM